MRKLAKKKRKSKRIESEDRSTWRPWIVVYRKHDRIGGVEPSGVLITDSAIVPLPIAFISNGGRDAVRLALRIIRGKASFADVLDYRGGNWVRIGSRINGAIIFPLSPATGKPDLGIDHLDGAQIVVDPIDGAVSFRTMDYVGLRSYIGTQNWLDWAIPRAVAKQNAEAA